MSDWVRIPRDLVVRLLELRDERHELIRKGTRNDGSMVMNLTEQDELFALIELEYLNGPEEEDETGIGSSSNTQAPIGIRCDLVIRKGETHRMDWGYPFIHGAIWGVEDQGDCFFASHGLVFQDEQYLSDPRSFFKRVRSEVAARFTEASYNLSELPNFETPELPEINYNEILRVISTPGLYVDDKVWPVYKRAMGINLIVIGCRERKVLGSSIETTIWAPGFDISKRTVVYIYKFLNQDEIINNTGHFEPVLYFNPEDGVGGLGCFEPAESPDQLHPFVKNLLDSENFDFNGPDSRPDPLAEVLEQNDD
jgi:hypothetical protein